MAAEKLDPQTNESQERYILKSFKASETPKQYMNFIMSRYLRSLRYGNDYFKMIDSDSYYAFQKAYFLTLLQRPSARITMGLLPDDDTIVGWCLSEQDAVHYVFVLGALRSQGIGKVLLPKDFKVVTHVTKFCVPWLAKHFRFGTINPYHGFTLNEQN